MTSNARRFLAAVVATMALALVLGAAGCGGKSKKPAADASKEDGRVVVSVGDRKVTAGYYVSRLKKMTQNDLPRDGEGEAVDTATPAGRRAFLDVIINKELMVLKAGELGYDEQDDVKKLVEAVTHYQATAVMRTDLIQKPGEVVTDEEIKAYHERRTQVRHFEFIICNFEADAAKARQAVLDGGLWETVAEEYNDGSRGPTNDYRMQLQYGTADDMFERPLFELGVGEVSRPIESVYGYWVVRLDSIATVRERPLDEDYSARIRATIAQKRAKLREAAFIKESRERHEFKYDDAALWIVFNGLPEEEAYLDPATQKPVEKDRLQPLNIPASELGRFFFSFKADKDAEPQVWTIGDYKAKYDEMSVFQRPKRNTMLGGVKNKLFGDIVDQSLFAAEARERGYDKDPRVIAEANERSEQHMLSLFHDEVVKYDEHVSMEAIRALYDENPQVYRVPEERRGRIMMCADKGSADAARTELAGGQPWSAVFAARNRSAGGTPEGQVSINEFAQSADRDQLFALARPGEVSAPFQAHDLWCVVMLDNVTPGRSRPVEEVINEVGARVKRKRQDEALQTLLAQWRNEYPVKINDRVLDSLPSWEELQAAK
ncbi:MAG: peptidylprolyl isomerase [Candidatus Latescibacteria bacterium]|nr:peptidylprolyl isomerase [Candidatus Latescibacterota bacterium]